MNSPEVDIATVISTPFEENCYVVRRPGQEACLVVDPGMEPAKIVAHLDQRGLVPEAILNTHGHADHIAGNITLKERWPDCPLVIGAREAGKLTDARENLSADFGIGLTSPPADRTVTDGQRFSAAGFDLLVRQIPGHSAGHVVYLWEEPTPAIVFVGDVIFAGGIGRTDFPDGDHRQLIHGIREKLFTLPDPTVLLPGHGPATTVGEEKRTNPFF